MGEELSRRPGARAQHVRRALLALALATGVLAVCAGPSFAAPANDDFANATQLSGIVANLPDQTNEGATGQPGEPDHAGRSLAFDANFNVCADAVTPTPDCITSIWYVWTPQRDGDVVIDTCNPLGNFDPFSSGDVPPLSADTTLAVYTGSALDALQEVASNDDSAGSGGPDCNYVASRVTFRAIAGTTYKIAVASSRSAFGRTGLVALHLFQELNLNDDFSAATPLSGDSADLVDQSTVKATGQPGEPDHAGSAFADSCRGPTAPDPSCVSSVWYTWSATTDESVTVDLCDPTTKLDTVLAVYAGAAPGSLSEIAGNDDAAPFCPGAADSDLASALSFRAAAGATYSIAVAGFHAQRGHFALHLRASPAGPLPVGDSTAAAPGPAPTAGGETAAAPASPPPPAPPASTPVALVLSAVSLSHSVFSVAGGSTDLPKRVAVGTKFRFRLSEPAKVSISIVHRLAGRRRGRACVRPSAALRHAPRCTRLIAAGTLTRASRQGADAVAFSGRIGARALKPGRYRATLEAIDAAGTHSARRIVVFRVVRGR